MNLDAATGAVVTVGHGRGFVVEGARDRLVITAAHCLPHLPPAAAIAGAEERTYWTLLAPLGIAPSVTTECLFVDPVSDIAVLGPPDNQELFEEAAAYDEIMETLAALTIARAPRQSTAFLLSLSNEWHRCTVSRPACGSLWVCDAINGIEGGMSGSPIMSENGEAIGVCTSGCSRHGEISQEGGPNPSPVDNLPAWLLRQLQNGRHRRVTQARVRQAPRR